MNNIKDIDVALLEGYLAGDIEAHEVLDAHGNTVSKESLELAIDEYRDIVIQLEGAAFKEQLKDISASVNPRPEKQNLRLWYAVAAAVLVLVTAGIIWQNMNKPPVFEDYFGHFDQLVSLRGENNSAAEGIEAYSDRDYGKAFDLLSAVEESELSVELKFYLGVSALGSSQVKEAISVFEEIGIERPNKYYQQTRWYLGLAYWQNGQLDKAVETLESIEAGQYKYQQAQNLIQELR